MNINYYNLREEYKPVTAMVCYSGNGGSYVEIHSIGFTQKGGMVLSEGKPLTKKSLRELLATTEKDDDKSFSTVTSLMPENVLYADGRPSQMNLMWYEKAIVKDMLFEGSKKPRKLPMPGLLFHVKHGDLHIYSIDCKGRPTLSTKLYHAPLFNLHNNGVVCMGNVKRPKNVEDIADLVQRWSMAFWKSYFTGELNRDLTKTPLKALYKRLEGKSEFPKKELKAINKTIKNIL